MGCGGMIGIAVAGIYIVSWFVDILNSDIGD